MRTLSIAALAIGTLSCVVRAISYTPVNANDILLFRGKVIHYEEIDTTPQNELNGDEPQNGAPEDSLVLPAESAWRDLDEIEDNDPIFQSFANITFLLSLNNTALEETEYASPFLQLDGELEAQNATWKRTPGYYNALSKPIVTLKLGGPSDLEKLRNVTNIESIAVATGIDVDLNSDLGDDETKPLTPEELDALEVDTEANELNPFPSVDTIGKSSQNGSIGSDTTFKPVYEGLVELCKKVQVLAPPVEEVSDPEKQTGLPVADGGSAH